MADGTGGRSHERELERYERILTAMGDGVYALDAAGRFVQANEYLLDLMGYDRETVIGTDATELYEAADIGRFEEAIAALVEGDQQVAAVEAAPETADGERIPVEVNLTLLPSDDGSFRGTVGVVRDFTERRERERELEQYETIVETIPDGVFVIDETGTIVAANETGARMIGYEREDVVGDTFEQLVDRGVFDRSIVDTYTDFVREMLSDRSDRERARYLNEATVDGERRVLESHLTLRPFDEEFRGTIGAFRDVTGQKEREAELERKNERLEQFASVVSHDLRNPLNVARGYAGQLDGDAADEIGRSLDRMETILEEMLALARQGRTIDDPGPVVLSAVAETAWRTVATGDTDLSVAGGVTVLADRERLVQLLENLFRNAVEHGDAERLVVGWDREEGVAFVADDGVGIPPDRRETVFELGATTGDDGTGFGLAIVEAIASAHGWAVSIRDAPDGGARFELAGVDVVEGA